MYFREPTEEKPIKIRDNPMHRISCVKNSGSTSVKAIIHGDTSNKSNHYIDGDFCITQHWRGLKEITRLLTENNEIKRDS